MEEKSSVTVRQKQQINALRSGNRTAVLETLKELRSSGRVFILPELFNLLADQEDAEIISVTASLLNDLKDQEAAPLLVVHIKPETALRATSIGVFRPFR